MKLITLTQGKFAQVDDSDYEWLMQWKWYVLKNGNTFYSQRTSHRKTFKMHREILSTPKGVEVDHKDHNGLNDQRDNIWNCTRGQNSVNKEVVGKSKYRGVSPHPSGFVAQINENKKHFYLGLYKTEEAAAMAFDRVAFKYRGSDAQLNFKENKYAI